MDSFDFKERFVAVRKGGVDGCFCFACGSVKSNDLVSLTPRILLSLWFISSKNMRLFLLLLVGCSSAFAVDRSKFRTCQQTAFCRRNRQHANGTPNNSHVLYQYQILPHSVHFHLPHATTSTQRQLQSEDIPGPPPTLTATLQNTASTTTAAAATDTTTLFRFRFLGLHDRRSLRYR